MSLVVLRLPFLFFNVKLENSLFLRLAFFLIKLKLCLQPFLTNHDALLIYDIIELAIVLLKYLILITSIQASILIVLLLILVIQLLEYILNLPLKLFVGLIHQVL